MILRPAGRFLTFPFPPGPLAARALAAVIRPPLLFFAMCNHLLSPIRLENNKGAVSLKHNQTSFRGKPDNSSRAAFATGAVTALDEVPKRQRLPVSFIFHGLRISG